MHWHIVSGVILNLLCSALAVQFDPKNQDPSMALWFKLHGLASLHNKLYKFSGFKVAGTLPLYFLALNCCNCHALIRHVKKFQLDFKLFNRYLQRLLPFQKIVPLTKSRKSEKKMLCFFAQILIG